MRARSGTTQRPMGFAADSVLVNPATAAVAAVDAEQTCNAPSDSAESFCGKSLHLVCCTTTLADTATCTTQQRERERNHRALIRTRVQRRVLFSVCSFALKFDAEVVWGHSW